MTEFWKTVRAYRKWIGPLVLAAAFVFGIRMGWIDERFVDWAAGIGLRFVEAVSP